MYRHVTRSTKYAINAIKQILRWNDEHDHRLCDDCYVVVTIRMVTVKFVTLWRNDIDTWGPFHKDSSLIRILKNIFSSKNRPHDNWATIESQQLSWVRQVEICDLIGWLELQSQLRWGLQAFNCEPVKFSLNGPTALEELTVSATDYLTCTTSVSAFTVFS